MKVMRKYLAFCLLILLLPGCGGEQGAVYTYQKTAIGETGIVVSAHPLATLAGVQILEKGGNAIDAAIAVQLALAVVYPRAGNIGGGGFLVYRNAHGECAALDFREKAPQAASRDMYIDSMGNVIPGLSTEGALAAGIPGTIAGMQAAHQRYGRMKWDSLFSSAIGYAREGHPITAFEADRLNQYGKEISKFSSKGIPFLAKSIWKEGDLLVQPELAQTLDRIATSGADEFYQGQTATFVLDKMRQANGLFTAEDLATYHAEWRTPIAASYRGYDIITMPLPSSGGVTLIQLLNIVEGYPLSQWGKRDVRTIHLMIEAERRAFADRAEYLGDPDFISVPVDSLTDKIYLSERMSDFNLHQSSRSTEIHTGQFNVPLESYETTHFSVVDAEGNAVAITTTLNTNYGCKVYVDGAGFFLNSEMDDFSVKPGHPNYYGLIGAEANAIAPGKRMLSSMTPTIIARDGNFFLSAGSPGGPTIITSVFQIILDVIDFGMTASEAVAAPRFHHQWLPDEVVYEPTCFSNTVLDSLDDMGHTLRQTERIGMVEAILRLPDGRYEGAADPRESDHADTAH